MPKMNTSRSLMIPSLEVFSQEELFSVMCRKAEEKGFVSAGYYADLIAREKDFPTGLNYAVPIAIPHVGTNCNTSFFAVATLKNPLTFHDMGDPDDVVEAQIIFMFGIVNPAEQVTVLKSLCGMFRQKEFLQKLLDATTQDEIMVLLEENLGDLISVCN